MAWQIPPNAYAHPWTVTPELVDVQGRAANHEIVRVVVETAVHHSDALGWDFDAYRRLGAWWVVRRHEIDYRAPALLDDELLCHTWPSAFSKTTGERRNVLARRHDDEVIARARTVWALIDMETGRPRRISPELFASFDPAQWVGA